jgi:hypothetical protein
VNVSVRMGERRVAINPWFARKEVESLGVLTDQPVTAVGLWCESPLRHAMTREKRLVIVGFSGDVRRGAADPTCQHLSAPCQHLSANRGGDS